MHTLVIGIDGGDLAILKAMPMPFVHGLLDQYQPITLQENLINRGWAEILSGREAADTNAFYLMPLCDKTYRFSRSYGLRDLLRNDDVTPLWRLLNQRGYKVGFMNVPTTSPAPEVDGFLVSGGGGGIYATAGVPPHMMHPRENRAILEKAGYIFDIRLGSAGVQTFSELVQRIEEAHDAQRAAYLELCAQHRPDFGFFCFRITTELQYLAMSEIEDYQERRHQQGAGQGFPPPRSEVQRALLRHYEHMDGCIRTMIETLQPRHVIFTADHGTAPYRKEFNTDILLQDLGYQQRMLAVDRLRRISLKAAKRLIPAYVKALVKTDKPGPKVRVPFTPFDKRRTAAFGTFFESGNFAGIYINDAVRFGGPINGEVQVRKLTTEIIKRFNDTPQAATYGLRAEEFRQKYAGHRYEHVMPDIRIIKPDHCYFTCRKPEFSMDNPNYGPVPMDIRGLRYPHTGVKSSQPLFLLDPTAATMIRDDDPTDLRTVYRVIERLFR